MKQCVQLIFQIQNTHQKQEYQWPPLQCSWKQDLFPSLPDHSPLPQLGSLNSDPSAQEDLGKRSNQTWSIESGIFEDILRRSVETASWLKQNAGIFPTILDPTISGEHRLEDRPAQEKGVAVQWAQWGPSPAPRLLADLGHLSGFHIFDGYCKSKRIRQSPQNSASLTQGLPRKKP